MKFSGWAVDAVRVLIFVLAGDACCACAPPSRAAAEENQCRKKLRVHRSGRIRMALLLSSQHLCVWQECLEVQDGRAECQDGQVFFSELRRRSSVTKVVNFTTHGSVATLLQCTSWLRLHEDGRRGVQGDVGDARHTGRHTHPWWVCILALAEAGELFTSLLSPGSHLEMRLGRV